MPENILNKSLRDGATVKHPLSAHCVIRCPVSSGALLSTSRDLSSHSLPRPHPTPHHIRHTIIQLGDPVSYSWETRYRAPGRRAAVQLGDTVSYWETRRRAAGRHGIIQLGDAVSWRWETVSWPPWTGRDVTGMMDS
eukprot:Polyplicarium_translucidae@DN3157_c0_g2_i10.p2